MKYTTIKTNTTSGIVPVEGRVCILSTGEKKHKCFLQYVYNGVEQSTPDLLDYKSGVIIQRAAALSAAKLSNFRSYSSLTDRSAAQIALDNTIAKCGIERFYSVVNSATPLNEGK